MPTPADRSVMARAIAATVARSSVAMTTLLFAYFMLPMNGDRSSLTKGAVALVATTVFLVVFVRQVRRITQARYPVLRAVEALVTVATLFVVVVASVHVALATQNPSAYSEALTRMDGLYFTVTVLATVGFGDITPVSETARIVTTVQMVLGVALLGAGVRLLLAVARGERDRRRGSVSPDSSADD